MENSVPVALYQAVLATADHWVDGWAMALAVNRRKRPGARVRMDMESGMVLLFGQSYRPRLAGSSVQAS